MNNLKYVTNKSFQIVHFFESFKPLLCIILQEMQYMFLTSFMFITIFDYYDFITPKKMLTFAIIVPYLNINKQQKLTL